MLASKSEKDSLGGTLFFNVAHYILRPWPWILVGLASLIVYPTLADIQKAFPNVSPSLVGNDIAFPAMLKFLPTGWIGLMVGGLIAANSSTILSHLNWGASYLVHDFYRRFIHRAGTEKHYRASGPHRNGAFVRAFLVTGVCVANGATEFLHHSSNWRGDGPAVSSSLVLVASDGVVRNRGDGQLVRHRAGLRVNGKSSARRGSPTVDRRNLHERVLDHYGIRRAADRSENLGRFLSQGAPIWSWVAAGAHSRRSIRGRSGELGEDG